MMLADGAMVSYCNAPTPLVAVTVTVVVGAVQLTAAWAKLKSVTGFNLLIVTLCRAVIQPLASLTV
jgi:uncharacterized membrane protein